MGEALKITLIYDIKQGEYYGVPLREIVQTAQEINGSIESALADVEMDTTIEAMLQPRGIHGVRILEWIVSLVGTNLMEMEEVLDKYLSAREFRPYEVSYNCREAKKIAHKVFEGRGVIIQDSVKDSLLHPFRIENLASPLAQPSG